MRIRRVPSAGVAITSGCGAGKRELSRLRGTQRSPLLPGSRLGRRFAASAFAPRPSLATAGKTATPRPPASEARRPALASPARAHDGSFNDGWVADQRCGVLANVVVTHRPQVAMVTVFNKRVARAAHREWRGDYRSVTQQPQGKFKPRGRRVNSGVAATYGNVLAPLVVVRVFLELCQY